MARNIITGIDIGTSTIKVLIAEKKKDGQIHILGASKKLSRGIRKGYVANFDEVAETIKEAALDAEKMAGISVKRAYIAIGGIILGSTRSKGSIMVSKADGEITEYDIKRVISQGEDNIPNNSNKRVINAFPLNFKIDGNLSLGRPTGMKGGKLEAEIFFITCLNQHLLDLIKAVESAGIAVEDIVVSPLAASFSALNGQQKEMGCVLADIGAGTVSIMVFEESRPISLEVFPIGSTHITNDIALGLQITLEDAEKIKIDHEAGMNFSKRKLSDIIEARLNDIFELIESHLKKINRDGLLPAGIILTGGGSSLVSLDEVAKASLRLPAKVGVPLDSQNEIISPKNLKEHILSIPEWSVVTGLCLAGFNEDANKTKVGEKLISKTSSIAKKWLRSFLP